MVISETLQLDSRPRSIVRRAARRPAEPDEVVAFCPACKTFETVPYSNEGLGKTRRFIQEGSRVFHLCGSTAPCRLLRKI